MRYSFIPALAVSFSRKPANDDARAATKMTITLPERRNRHPFFICRRHFIQTCRRCGRWIIHVFLIQWIFRVAPPVLGFSVGTTAFFGSPIATLSFPAGCPAGTQPASIRAIGLSPPATPADAKANLAPTTENKNKLQKNPTLKSAGERSRIKKLYRASGLTPKFILKARNGRFGLFLFVNASDAIVYPCFGIAGLRGGIFRFCKYEKRRERRRDMRGNLKDSGRGMAAGYRALHYFVFGLGKTVTLFES